MEQIQSTTVRHYLTRLTCTLVVLMGLLGLLAPVSHAAKGAFSFSAATSAVNEGGGKIDITINRLGGSTGSASVTFQTKQISALAGSDFVNIPMTTLNFAHREQKKVVSVAITNDTVVDPNETFEVLLSNPTYGTMLGSISSSVITIQDDDVATADTTAPTVSLTSPASSTIFTTPQTVSIIAAASDNVGVSKVELYDGATLLATDSSATYNFAWAISSANNGSHSLTAKAYDAAGNSKISAVTAVTVNIPVAQAQPGAFSYAVSNTSVNEGAGKVNITINRVGGSDGIATIDWRTKGVTATYAQDYGDFNWTTLTFASGEASKTQSINIVDDSLVEGDEVFNVLLSNPTGGATLGSITSSAITIVDNDTVSVDTTAPTVSLTSPATATTYTSTQTVTISASATDNIGVSKVEFYDGTTLMATDTTAPYSVAWTIAFANNGNHSLTAKAYDAAGNNKTSVTSAVTVNIPASDLTAPTVSISSPASGIYIDSTQAINIVASAQDNVGVTKVEFYDGAELKGTDSTSPYSFNWSISAENNGSHVFSCKAFDAAGNSKTSNLVTIVVDIATATAPSGPLPVFPGAQGFGTDTPAGRGGQIIKVTNLNDSGTGSLRAAMAATGPRIVVFEVGGTINITTDLRISNPYITVAGQTAPSPGIMIKGAGIRVSGHDVLIQHLRVRVGDSLIGPDPGNRDALQILGPAKNIVVDHVSVSWGVDEVMSTWNKDVSDVTISNCIISEGLNYSIHPEGKHSKGLLVGDWSQNVTVFGNLMANNWDRNPQIKGGTSALIFNNLSYNAKGDFTSITDNYAQLPHYLTTINNSFVYGPDTYDWSAGVVVTSSVKAGSKIFQKDNIATGKVFGGTTSYNVSTPPVWIEGLKVIDTSLVEFSVLDNAGARPADRDSVDKRIVNEVKTRTGKIIDSQSQVGGWPNLTPTYRVFSLPSNPNADDDRDGYTNIEETLHTMAAAVEGR